MSSSKPRRGGATTRCAARTVALLLIGGAGGSGASAADTWDNSSSDALWSTPANWVDNGEPLAGDAVTFPVGFPPAGTATTVTLSPAELALSLLFNDSYTLSGGSLALGAGGQIGVASGKLATINSDLTGGTGLTKTGSGTLTLTAHSFTGQVQAEVGTLRISGDASLGNAANPVMINGGTLAVTGTFATSRTFSLGGGSGTIDVAAGRTLTLNTALGAGAAGFIVNPTGAGTLVLTAASARTGTTTINLGTIRVQHADALGSGAVTASGGTLEMGGVTFDKAITLSALGKLRGTGTSAATGQIVVDNSTLVGIAAGAEGDTFTVGNAANDLTGGIGSIVQVFGPATGGGGRTVLPFANNYQGGWSVADGTLRIENAGALGAAVSPVDVNATGALEIGSVTLGRGVALTGTLRGTGFASAVGSVNVTPGASVGLAAVDVPDWLVIGDASGDLTGGNAASNIAISGEGHVLINNASSYAGGWSVQSGVLQLRDPDSLGSGTSPVTLFGGKLAPEGLIVNRAIKLAGGTLASAHYTGNTTYAGQVTLDGSPSTASLTVDTAAHMRDLVISGQLTGTTALSVVSEFPGVGDTAALILTNPLNNHTNVTTVNTGAALASRASDKVSSALGSGNVIALAGGQLRLHSNEDTTYNNSVSTQANSSILVAPYDAGTAKTQRLSSVAVSSSRALTVQSSADYNLAISSLTLSGSGVLSQSAGTGVFITGPVTGTGSLRFGDAGVDPATAVAQLRETGIHFQDRPLFSPQLTVSGDMQRADAANTDPILGVHGASTTVLWNGDWVADALNSDSYFVLTNGGTLRFGGTATIDNAFNSSTFSHLRIVGDGTGTFEMLSPFIANQGPSIKLASLHVNAGLFKSNHSQNLPTNFILFDNAAWQAAGTPHTYAGAVTFTTAGSVTNGGSLTLNGAFGIGDATHANTTLAKGGFGIFTIAGPQSHGVGAKLWATQGSTVLNSDAGTAAARRLTVEADGGNVTFNSTQHLDGVAVRGTSLVTVGADATRVLVTGSAVIAANAKIDLTDNKMIVVGGNVGTASAGTYNGLQGEVQRAYNFGSWNGPGLTTTMQGALDGITTIGVATGEQIRGLGPTDTDIWAGETINGASAIAMYTYAGDANLDGQVDAGDYGILDAFIQVAGAAGYGNGDFNYDGFIDPADYGTIDNTVQFQGAPFPTAAAVLAGVTAVPEPAAAAVIALAGAGLSLRRRRRRTARSNRR